MNYHLKLATSCGGYGRPRGCYTCPPSFAPRHRPQPPRARVLEPPTQVPHGALVPPHRSLRARPPAPRASRARLVTAAANHGFVAAAHGSLRWTAAPGMNHSMVNGSQVGLFDVQMFMAKQEPRNAGASPAGGGAGGDVKPVVAGGGGGDKPADLSSISGVGVSGGHASGGRAQSPAVSPQAQQQMQQQMTWKYVQVVQSLIERCLQSHMSQVRVRVPRVHTC